MRVVQAIDLPDLVNLLIATEDPGGRHFGHGKQRLLFLDDAEIAQETAVRELLAGVAPGGHVAVLLRLESKGTSKRLLQFIGLPFRLRRAVRTLRSLGIANSQRFAVSPDVQLPVVVYSLRPTSAAYARTNILPSQRGAAGALRWLISRWAGCDPSVGAVLVIGNTP